MKVIVVGGGIVGVTTAYYLRQAGLEVDLIERRSDVAQETSLGNAGIIAPGYVTPWAAPGMPRKVMSYLFKPESPVLFKPRFNLSQWRWVLKWLKECDLERYRVNKARMQRVALYSRACLHALREKYSIDYQQSQGYLQLFRSESEMELSEPARQMLSEAGITHEVLDAQGVYSLEPEIARHTPLVGGLHLPGDEAGNCPLFAKRLRLICEADGVRFHFGDVVRSLKVEGGRFVGVDIRGSIVPANACVIAAGPHSPSLVHRLGLRLPIFPVKGYSATFMLRPEGFGPSRALMDEAFKTAITPLGNSIRVAGTAEISDSSLDMRETAQATLLKVASDWFPGAFDMQTVRYWVGARPMVPDGPPVLGATPIAGLFLNCGHGSTGWAMSCGSGRVLADLVMGREPEISLEGLTLARYGP